MLTKDVEKLRREIDQAHNAMFELSPSAGSKRPHPDVDTSVISSKTLKRARTAAVVTTDSPLRPTPSEKNRLKRTYSRKPARESHEETKDIWEFTGDDDSSGTTKGKIHKLGNRSNLPEGTPLLDVYQATAQTVNPLDTLNQKPVDPSPLHSSAFISPTNASDPYSHTFGSPSQQLPTGNVMGPGFDTHEPTVMFPDMSSTIAASSSSLEKRMTPAMMNNTTPASQVAEAAVIADVVNEVESTRLSEQCQQNSKQNDSNLQTSLTNAESNAPTIAANISTTHTHQPVSYTHLTLPTKRIV